jgi:formate dehydrogenase maturation protein FdhE
MSTTPGDFGPRLTRLEAARKEVEDSLVVMAHLEARQSRMLKEHAEYMAELDARLKQAEQQAAEQRRLNIDVDTRIADLVSAVGVLISQRLQ